MNDLLRLLSPHVSVGIFPQHSNVADLEGHLQCATKLLRERCSLPHGGLSSCWTVLTSTLGSRRRTIIIVPTNAMQDDDEHWKHIYHSTMRADAIIALWWRVHVPRVPTRDKFVRQGGSPNQNYLICLSNCPSCSPLTSYDCLRSANLSNTAIPAAHDYVLFRKASVSYAHHVPNCEGHLSERLQDPHTFTASNR